MCCSETRTVCARSELDTCMPIPMRNVYANVYTGVSELEFSSVLVHCGEEAFTSAVEQQRSVDDGRYVQR